MGSLKIRDSSADRIFYILFCISTLGAVWVIRVILSEAIRQAIQNHELH